MTLLIAGILAINGVVWLALSVLPLGAGLLAGAGLCAAAAVGLARWRRRLRAAAGAPRLIFDFEDGVLHDTGGELARLAELRLERTWQLGSSSRALTARWPGGKRVIARGNPFGDSVAAIEAALVARGVKTDS